MERARECEREREREMAIKKRAIRVGHSGKIVRVAVDGFGALPGIGIFEQQFTLPAFAPAKCKPGMSNALRQRLPASLQHSLKMKAVRKEQQKKASSRRSAFVYIFMFIASSGPPLPCGKVRCATRAERTNWSVRVVGNMIVNDGRMKLAYTLRDQFTIRRWR